MVVLQGRVASGRGDLNRWMAEYAETYERVVGVRLFPGSLNLVLDHEWVLPPDPVRIEPSEYGGRVGMNIVPCFIADIEAFILRTDQNEAGTGHHDRRVLEIAAPVRLRDVLRLEDGDLVEVVVGGLRG